MGGDGLRDALAATQPSPDELIGVYPVDLATSRIPLRLRIERQFRVAALSTAAAAWLFTERARAVDASSEPDQATQDAITEVCAGLDGMPLAIELAAAGSGCCPLPPFCNGSAISSSSWLMVPGTCPSASAPSGPPSTGATGCGRWAAAGTA